MSNRTPPKSKRTARTLIAALLGRGRRYGLLLVGGERHPAALQEALLVDLSVLLAGRPVTPELRDRILGARLVPLLVGGAAARGEPGGESDDQRDPSRHGRHDTMATRC